MAINVKNQYPVGTNPPDADYPEGSAVSSTTTTSKDGFPFAIEYINDMLGFLQSILRESGVSANDVVDTARASQYFRGLIELSAGRATNYIDSGVANAYVVGPSSGQQTPMSRFNGRVIKFTPLNTNTGAATVNVFSEGVDDIKLAGGSVDPYPRQIESGVEVTLIDRLSYYELYAPVIDLSSYPAVHNMISDANYSLSNEQDRRAVLSITDTAAVLTAPKNIVVSNRHRLFIASNETLQPLTFKTSLGSGVTVNAGESAMLVCNGTDVISAYTSSVLKSLTSLLTARSIDIDTVIDGSLKAFVEFDGTGAVAIGSSFNVTSVVDNGVGNYTINLANPFSDTEYGVNVTSHNSSGYYESKGVSSFDVLVNNYSGTPADRTEITVTVVDN